jgi:hypothetical protein
MMNKLVKATLQKAVRWLEDNPNHMVNSEAQQPSYSLYPWLNSMCLKISAYHPNRSYYVWGIVNAAALARALKIPRISVIELGVAGGNGLIAMENIALRVEAEIKEVQIDVYGFDTGIGLPKPMDYRDLPNLFIEGLYPMDVDSLQGRLSKAELNIGSVESSIPKFIASGPSPVGFISFDLDFYSSTMHALRLLEADQKLLLPRVHCYFDDIIGFTYSEFTGELLAIAEFNASHVKRKISQIKGLTYYVAPEYARESWVEQFYMAHIFDHELYGHFDMLNQLKALNLVRNERGVNP